MSKSLTAGKDDLVLIERIAKVICRGGSGAEWKKHAGDTHTNSDNRMDRQEAQEHQRAVPFEPHVDPIE